MKIMGVLFFLCACGAPKKAPGGDCLVSGTVSVTSSYCGGARPTDEVLLEYNKPKPYSGKRLYFRKGSSNDLNEKIVGTVVSDDSGFFSLRLSPGIYAILQEEHLKPLDLKQYESPGTLSADSACFAKWWATPLKVIEVKAGEPLNIEMNFHKQCFISKDVPCLHYDGPMPP